MHCELFIMFNLDNLDLEFDDDFSANIFSKRVDSRIINAVDTKLHNEEIKSSEEITAKCDEVESSSKKLQEEHDSEITMGSKIFLDFPLMKNSRENNFKRFCVEDKRQKKSFHDVLLQRKFPGPAGLLPDKKTIFQPFKEITDLSLVLEKTRDETEDKRDKEESMVYSQCSVTAFLTSNYQKLLSDFNLKESENPLNRYTVEWVKKTALSKGLQKKKIPFLGLIVHSVSQGMPDPVLVLRDPTGEIHGSLHREVWVDMGGKLKTGIALALRQVGVLITGVIRRRIYLNITMNNILSLYSSSENENQVEVTTINKVSQLELLNSFEEWLAQSSKTVFEKPSSNFSLFKTISSINTPPKNHKEINILRNKLENLVDESKAKKAKSMDKNSEEELTNLGIILADGDFNDEEMTIPQDSTSQRVDLERSKTVINQGETSGQMLSQAESLIFEEVLSGIDLDEFEM